VQLKVIGRIWTKTNYVRPQIKNPKFQGFNLDNASFTHYSSHSLAILDDWVSTF